MPEKARTRNRITLALVVLMVAVGALYYALRSSRNTVVVRTARADRQSLVNIASTNGRVEALVDFQPRAPIASEIAYLPLKLGEQVARGQELVRLDESDARSKIAAAQATLTGAQANLRNMQAGGTQDELLTQKADLSAAESQAKDASRSLETLQALQVKGAASANEVAAAHLKVSDAQAKVAQIRTRMQGRYGAADVATQRAQVAEAHAALSAAQSGFSGVDVRSPISGTVYALPFNQYDYVPAGDPLVSIADLTRLQVRAYFEEAEIGPLAAGQPVTIRWDAKPNQLWHGHVTQAPTAVITYNGSRNVGVCLISVDDAHGELIPNINVTVRVTTSEHLNVLSVPREALHPEGGSHFVYKVVAGKLIKTSVTVHEGDINLTRVGISGGLQEGDVVALEATTDVDLEDGMRVKAQL